MCYNRDIKIKRNEKNCMISVLDLIRELDFEPEIIYLHDGERTIRIDYASLKEEFGYNLDSFLELVPMNGKVYFSEHVWKNEIDLHCDTTLLEILKQNYEEQNGVHDQKISNLLLLVQHALEDLKFGDTEGISELTELLETNAVEI